MNTVHSLRLKESLGIDLGNDEVFAKQSTWEWRGRIYGISPPSGPRRKRGKRGEETISSLAWMATCFRGQVTSRTRGRENARTHELRAMTSRTATRAEKRITILSPKRSASPGDEEGGWRTGCHDSTEQVRKLFRRKLNRTPFVYLWYNYVGVGVRAR